MKNILRLIIWLLPASRMKNALLRGLGHQIDPAASVGPNLVWKVERFTVGQGGRVLSSNVFKGLRTASVGKNAHIGRRNHITASPTFVRHLPDGGELILADHATVTSRHALDCSGSIHLGCFSIVAGRGSLLMTHSLDVRMDAQSARPIEIGERSFVSTSVIILGGATFPPRSLLAAGAVLPARAEPRDPGVWGGVPAKRIGDAEGAWFDREATQTHRVYVPATGQIVERAG